MSLRKQVSKLIITVSMVGAFTMAVADDASDLSQFSKTQRAQLKAYIQKSVPDAIMQNPKVVINAVQKYQQQQQQQRIDSATSTILANVNNFLRNPASPTENKNGKVTLVEFYDYQCSVCHMMYPIIRQVAKDNPNLRVVYKDLPIFGPASVYAARGSFAAYQQSLKLYLAYRNALFTSGKMEGKLTDKDVDAIAQKVGLDMTKFKHAVDPQYKDTDEYKQVTQDLQGNADLARSLQLTGTPAMIIAPSTATSGTPKNKVIFIPGGAQAASLDQAVNAVQHSMGA